MRRTSTTPRRENRAAAETQWLAFALVTGAYLSVTVAESLLPPLYPVIADDLDLSLRLAGIAFGLLTGSIAVGNIVGGYLLARRGPKTGLACSLAVAALGAVLAATAGGRLAFLVSQAVIGLGVGVFFAPGINAVGLLAGSRRRGLAMGIFGVAFSGGLTLAAVLAAAGAGADWQLAFWVAAAMSALALAVVLPARLPPRRIGPHGGERKSLRVALGIPVVVGGVGTASQYGTVSFLPAFAVVTWGLSPATAALLLAAGRATSVPAKLIAGGAADRWGSHATVVGLGAVLVVTGAVWTLVPAQILAVPAAVVFVGTVSAMFPVANLLAVEGFGERGPLLGAYRAVQIAIGAAVAALIGLVSASVGLGPTLAVTALLPAVLFTLRHTAPVGAPP